MSLFCNNHEILLIWLSVDGMNGTIVMPNKRAGSGGRERTLTLVGFQRNLHCELLNTLLTYAENLIWLG